MIWKWLTPQNWINGCKKRTLDDLRLVKVGDPNEFWHFGIAEFCLWWNWGFWGRSGTVRRAPRERFWMGAWQTKPSSKYRRWKSWDSSPFPSISRPGPSRIHMPSERGSQARIQLFHIFYYRHSTSSPGHDPLPMGNMAISTPKWSCFDENFRVWKQWIGRDFLINPLSVGMLAVMVSNIRGTLW
jgi:hypothetical protein